MAECKRRVYCTFPKEQIGQPVLYQIGQRFQVMYNIRGASIDDEVGLVYLELQGETAEVDAAIEYLRSCNVETKILEDGAE